MKQQWDTFWTAQENRQIKSVSWSKRRIINVLEKYVRNGMPVMDAGCGTGFFSSYFLSKKCSVYSLDYSQKALEITMSMTEGKSEAYINKDLLDENLPTEYSQAFDIIFSDGLFEHFPAEEQQRILRAFMVMKARQGVIITFVPNRYSFWTVVRPLLMPGIKEKPFTLKSLTPMIEQSGQSIIETGGINVLPTKYSPEYFGANFGMLVYAVSR